MYGRPWTIYLNTDTGPDNITNVTTQNISIHIHSPNGGVPDWVSTGAITIVTANPSVISWQPTAQDYALAGTFQAYPLVTFPGAPAPVAYDPIPFEVDPF